MLDSQFLKKIGQNLKLESSSSFPFKVIWVGLNLSQII